MHKLPYLEELAHLTANEKKSFFEKRTINVNYF